MIPKLAEFVSDELIAYLEFRDLPLTHYEKAKVLNTPDLDLMMASLVGLMKTVVPRNLRCRIEVKRTKFNKDAVVEADATASTEAAITNIKQRLADFGTRPKLKKNSSKK